MDTPFDHAMFDFNESFTRWLEPMEVSSPVIRDQSKRILEEAYGMWVGDVSSHIHLHDSSKLGIGGMITSTSYHKVDKMTETYMETDRDGNVVFAVIPPCIATHTLDDEKRIYCRPRYRDEERRHRRSLGCDRARQS
jgi:hypothetical protein